MLEPIRKQIPHEEFDYQTLLEALKGYAHPRDKITSLLRKGAIIRVKKGLYVFGKDYRNRPYSRENLANLIYGPSYISLEYALQYYGMIPERVEAVTSVTVGRSRKFSTPIGLFIYRMIPMSAFRSGIDKVDIGDERSFLIALPEKALADKIRQDRGASILSQKDLRSYLFDNLRLDSAVLRDLNPERLAEYAKRYRSRKIMLLAGLIRRIRKHGKGNVMHEAVVRMLSKYECSRLEDYTHALREILQEITLLGLWRGKFFEKAAFYGGTAMRILYGLDRFSEDLDFSNGRLRS